MVPAHFHDVTDDKIAISEIKFSPKYCKATLNDSILMLTEHFHDVNYGHIWLKKTAGAHKEPNKKDKSHP